MRATSVAGNEIFDIVVEAELYVKYQADSKQKTTIEGRLLISIRPRGPDEIGFAQLGT